MGIDMGIGGLEFGSGVTRFPGLVWNVYEKDLKEEAQLIFEDSL